MGGGAGPEFRAFDEETWKALASTVAVMGALSQDGKVGE